MKHDHFDSQALSRTQRTAFVWMILIVAGFLRVWGVIHDLPYTYFGDEEHFINRSLAFGSGDLNPHWFHKPAFYMYWLFAEYGLYFVVGSFLGWFTSVSDFAQHFFVTMEPFIIIGRLTTVGFSVATVYLTYRIGKQYINGRVGLLAAWFLALCMGHFTSSIVVKADVPATFFAMLSLFFIFSIYRKHRWEDYLLAGLFAGIGTATKYYPLTMLLPIFVAHALIHWEKPAPFYNLFFSQKLVGAVLAWFAGFFVGSPYNFLDPTWLKHIGGFVQKVHTIGEIDRDAGFVANSSPDLLEKLWSIVISLKNLGGVVLDHSGMGLLLGIFALVGIALFPFRGNRKGLICFAYVVGFAVVASIVNPSYARSRHLSMLFPMLCIGSAVVVEFGCSRVLTNIKSQSWKSAYILLVSVLLVSQGAALIVGYDVRISQKDTRLLAKEWIETHIPPQTKILLDEQGPKLQWSRTELEELYQVAKKDAKVGPFTTHLETYFQYRIQAVKEPAYEIKEIYHPWWLPQEKDDGVRRLDNEKDRDMGNPLKPRGVMPLAFYQQYGYEYIVTHSEAYGAYIDTPKKNLFPSFNQFYNSLFEKGELVKEFSPDPWFRSGPNVKIYRIRTSSKKNI